MTFSLPVALAAKFIKRVSARDRSRYVAEALAARLRGRAPMLAGAAEMANRSHEVRAIEQEFEKLENEPAEPWDDALMPAEAKQVRQGMEQIKAGRFKLWRDVKHTLGPSSR